MTYSIDIPDDAPSEIVDAINDLRKDITDTLAQTPSVLLCHQVRDALAPQFATKISVSPYAVYMTHTAKSFKVLPEVYSVWRRVFGVRHAWNTTPSEADLKTRFIFNSGGLYIYATLELDIDGATCSAVKVGEKTVTMPVYEMRCDGTAVDTKLPEVEE